MTPAHHTSGGSTGSSSSQGSGSASVSASRGSIRSPPSVTTAPSVDDAVLDTLRAADADLPHQNTALPPEMSYVAPVENEHSSLASQQISAATSSAVPIRPIGMRSTM